VNWLVDWKIGKYHIKNLEIFTITILTIIYALAATIQPGSWLYEWIAHLSKTWHDTATESDSALWMAFIFSTFANTSVLIVFPYALIVFDIGKTYPNYWLLGLVSGIGAGIGEIASYIVGSFIGSSKKVQETELGEKFHRMRLRFEKKPGLIPFTIFFFALTPLPDDVILVPFGMMKYPIWKSVPPCMAGKTLMCTLLAYLGHWIGQNARALNWLIEEYPYLSILRLVVPTEDVNPSADLIQFSMVFIIIYIMVRLDFEKMAIKRSKERKDFEQLLKEGGNFHYAELVERYSIINKEGFKEFLVEFSENHPNLQIKDELYHFDAISDVQAAYEQSKEFAIFFNK
jgi:membrane protein YqaA with SNARE-associated domain